MPTLSATGRPAVLDRLAGRAYDVLVVGGGVTGAGIALDAAARGLRVALVERNDLASGTSSKSSKLVHGGLRYLAQGDVALVRESVAERELLRRLAPHLVRPQPFLVPAPGASAWRYGAGLWVYRGLAAGRRPERHERLTGDAWRAAAGPLAPPLDRGGYRFNDCRTDDARLVLQVARTAARFGADICTRCELVELRRAAGRVVGATVRDRIGGVEVHVAARWVVAATGVWADQIRGLADAAPLLQPSKGAHLVFDRAALPVPGAVIVPSAARDARTVFAIPWGDQVVAGTTDDHYDGPLDQPAVTAADAEYICGALNRAYGLSLDEDAAIGGWAGLRPLLRGGNEARKAAGRSSSRLDGADSEALSRRHAILVEPEGLLTITGGKLTTYRRMAADAVDVVARSMGRTRRSPTTAIPLGLRGSFASAVERARALCESFDVDPDVAAHLVQRHGDDAVRVIALVGATDGGEPLVPGLPYLRGEVRWALDEELALDLGDVLERRMRVSWRHDAAGGSAVEDVARTLAAALGWSETETADRAAAYRAAVRAERGPIPLREPVRS